MVKVAIHQPNYLPYIGYFQKMALADVFVILDNVQFSKDSYTQRAKIRTKNGWMWLTIPVGKENNFKLIKDASLPEDNKWKKKHRTSLISNYSKCEFMDAEFIDKIYLNSDNCTKLQQVNEMGIFYLKNQFGIDTEIIKASELNLDPNLKSTDLLVEIVNYVGGSSYISGTGGKKYLSESKFSRNNISLEYFEFSMPKYSQRWNGFEPYMSAIDLLFNLGPSSNEVIYKTAYQ